MSDPREPFAHVVAEARIAWAELLDVLADARISFRAPALRYTPQIQALATLDGRAVHMPFPDADDPDLLARLPILELLYGLSGEALAEFVRATSVPALAHELGHVLRIQSGTFAPARCWEEQVANRMIRALAPWAAPPRMRTKALARLADVQRWMGPTDAAWAYDVPGEGAPVPHDPERRAVALARRHRFEHEPLDVQIRDAVTWLRLTLVDARPIDIRAWVDEHAPALAN